MIQNKLFLQQLLILVVLFIGYALYFYNRKTLSFSISILTSNHHFSQEQIGLILSALNLAYMISKFFGGIIADHVNSRLLFSAGLFLSGLFACLFGFTQNPLAYIVIAFLLGIAQGFGWPSLALFIKRWFPANQLGTCWSVLSTSMNLAGSIGPFLTSSMSKRLGWNMNFMVPGLAAMGFSIPCITFLKEYPPVDPIDGSSPSRDSDTQRRHAAKSIFGSGSSWSDLLRSRYLWILTFCHIVVQLVRASVSDWSVWFLVEQRHLPGHVANRFWAALEMAGVPGSLFAGPFSDILRMRRSKTAIGNARRTVVLVAIACLAVLLAIFGLCIDVTTDQSYIYVIGFFMGIFINVPFVLLGVVVNEAAPAHLVGSSHAVFGLIGNLGAVCSGYPLSLLADWLGWNGAFLTLSGLCVLAAATVVVTRHVPPRIGHDDKQN